MESEQRVYEVLDGLEIAYRVHEHPAVYTVEEAKEHWENIEGGHFKNLFLRDKKGRKHYLLVAGHDRKIDLKEIARTVGSTPLSFASPERLMKYLGLTPGSVTPFGIVNDEKKEVIVLIDEKAVGEGAVNFHPNTNTRTLTLASDDFRRFLSSSGNRVVYLSLPDGG